MHIKLAFKYKFYCYLTELRQSAEGVDVLPDILGDGGGGGDGSSGNNSDADDGGPAGGNRLVTSYIGHEGLIGERVLNPM